MQEKQIKRNRRHHRVRAMVQGTVKVPRLCVFRSANHIYAQIIDDKTHKTVISVGSVDKEIKAVKDRKESAKQVGIKLAKLAKDRGVSRVTFDRGRYKYHGRVKALAESAREGGLLF